MRGGGSELLSPLSSFVSWLQESDVQHAGLEVRQVGTSERGVYATRNIASGALVVQVPRRALLQSADESEKFRRDAADFYDQLRSPHLVILVLAMLHNRTFQPYYDILPTSLTHFPVFWDNTDNTYRTRCDAMGSNFHAMVEQRRNQIDSEYKTLCNIYASFATMCSPLHYKRLRTLVGSRNFGVTIRGQKASALVPFADMLNHSDQPDVSWSFEDDLDAFCMRAVGAIPVGKEVTDSYGHKPSSTRLLYYGF